ncbi:MAG: adenosine deaminase [Candidatus Eisenbacteria bacterium]|uniref:adenosine deaminase n=1 Tax=Eiseniibacteriota bacterium TaxID=2212470 RepID=A0A948S1E8_UNCEI|nr:adenosine deaminase [Candidatus Eisenbacteria bacterium]MBU1947957.1 adenosine deaminase [Candidatus Eisenbacteria bacterium]MBU2693419.1 adenosine deaminase [Candidatus Eisenbacteria bacterium]
MTKQSVPRSLIAQLPKTDLHVHLDGSLRPTTLLELAAEQRISLPVNSLDELDSWLDAAHGSLPTYLEIFETTLKVLQTPDALKRVSYELAEDAHNENVRYLEVRFSPTLHHNAGLTTTKIIDAVVEGMNEARDKLGIRSGVILCGIRTISPEESLRLAGHAVNYKGRGVVAFDLAGAEKDYPAKDHLKAFYTILNNNVNCTVHAGEGFGAASINQAIHYCGAHRIGHGTRLMEDPDLHNYVRDHRIPLEMCLTSNVDTGATESFGTHPFKAYFDSALRVTLNTDNRFVSRTTMTNELDLACRTFGFSIYDLRRILINGFKSAFIPHDEKVAVLHQAIDEMDRLFRDYYPDTYRAYRTFL